MLKEVKEKIKLINRQLKSGGPILGVGGVTAEADNIIEESGYDSNGDNAQMQPQMNSAVQPHLQH